MIAELLRSQPRRRELRLTSFGWVQKHEGAPNARACVRARARAWGVEQSCALGAPEKTRNSRRAARPLLQNLGFRGREMKAGPEPSRWSAGPAAFGSGAGTRIPQGSRGVRGDLAGVQNLRHCSRESLVLLAAIGVLLRSFLSSFRRKPRDERLDIGLDTARTL